MAYTRDWDTEVLNTPPGTRDSDEIDDAIREFKVDLDERLRDMVWDLADDPVQVKVPGINVDGSQNIKVPAVDGRLMLNLQFDAASYIVKPTAVSQGGNWIASIPVPRGTTIHSVGFNVARKTIGAAVTCSVIKVQNATGIASPIPTVLFSGGAVVNANIQGVSAGVIDTLIDSGTDVLLRVDIAADGASVDNSFLASVDVAYYVAGVTP